MTLSRMAAQLLTVAKPVKFRRKEHELGIQPFGKKVLTLAIKYKEILKIKHLLPTLTLITT